MRKLAIFVEGFTEQIFVANLIVAIGGHNNVMVRLEVADGKMGDRRITLVSQSPNTGQSCYILIRNCQGDHNVASDVRDQYRSLASSGFVGIIGVRDIYPRPTSDIAELLGVGSRGMGAHSINYRLPISPIRVQWIFPTREIEAWFLSEHTHLERIHSNLTCERVLSELGFDPRMDDMRLRDHPSDDLHAIYNLEGLRYGKSPEEIQRTIDALDFAQIYADMEHVNELRTLVQVIDDFISSAIGN